MSLVEVKNLNKKFGNKQVLHDVTFDSLSTAATFVAGRISNGMITWKTPDGQYVRKTLKK